MDRNKIRIYVSHSIRGIKGSEATEEDMIANNLEAIEFGNWLKAEFPEVAFYIPGDHDEFVLIAYKEMYITEGEILKVDCTIVDRCHAILNFIPDQYISSGMLIENMHAQTVGKPIMMAKDIVAAKHAINCFLERLKK